jgi:outer membrane receptor protein involved in Fe transport
LDPKYIGALTLRGSYSEGFHAPTLPELTPASSQNFPIVSDPFTAGNAIGNRTEPQIEERILGNPNTHPETAYEWTYGAVYSPKWIKGLTLSADEWHIDMREIIAALGAQTIILSEPPPPVGTTNGASTVVGPLGQTVVRSPSAVPGEVGPVSLVIDPSANLSGAILEGLDYEAIYILDSSIFGHGDWGRLTTTINGTWLQRFAFQSAADTKRFGIAGRFLPPGFALTSSLPWQRANASVFYDGPADTWMQGLDVGAVVHWTSQYNDDNNTLTGSTKLNMPTTGGPNTPAPFPQRARTIAPWTTLDLLLNYTFNLPPPAPAEVPGLAKDGGKNVKTKDGKEKNVVPVSTAEYGCSNWQWWLNNTTVTLGMQNVTDADPPFVAGSFENGYDESIATIKGRFWYVGLKKRF